MNAVTPARAARLHCHGAVSAALALYSDRGLRELVDAAVPMGAGIGGKSALLEVTGTGRRHRVPERPWPAAPRRAFREHPDRRSPAKPAGVHRFRTRRSAACWAGRPIIAARFGTGLPDRRERLSAGKSGMRGPISGSA